MILLITLSYIRWRFGKFDLAGEEWEIGSKRLRPIPLRGTGPNGPCYLLSLLPDFPMIRRCILPAPHFPPLCEARGEREARLETLAERGLTRISYSGVIARRTR